MNHTDTEPEYDPDRMTEREFEEAVLAAALQLQPLDAGYMVAISRTELLSLARRRAFERRSIQQAQASARVRARDEGYGR